MMFDAAPQMAISTIDVGANERPLSAVKTSHKALATASQASLRSRAFRPLLANHEPETSTNTKADKESAVMQKFEASVLATFVEMMMPKDNEAVFGSGLSGEMWRSQLSSHIAEELARAGGIGIARGLQTDPGHDRVNGTDAGRISSLERAI